jgi:colanic acid biosynthesis glycosyl transferase WcaI
VRILLVGLNYAPEKVGIAVYTSGLAEALVVAGHDVEVIAGQPYYPRWQTEPGYSAWRWTRAVEKGVVVHRAPHYVPSNPTGIRRVIHHVTFAASSLAPALSAALSLKPDLVVSIAPSLLSAPVGCIAAQISGASKWLHVQDLEIEAAFGMGLLKEQSWLGHLARRFERSILQAFDRVSALTPEMQARLIGKGLPRDRATILRNWADPTISPRDPASAAGLRADLGITTPLVALYSGNIANKQGIEIVVEAARLLANRSDLTFLICGEGPNLEALKARGAGLPNLRFAPLQPKARLPELLALADIHLLPQLPAAAQVVMPSKLTNMLASGRPVVATADAGTALAREVEGAGIITKPEDPVAFANAVARLCDDWALRQRLGETAANRAAEVWSHDAIMNGFLEAIADLCAQRSSRKRVQLQVREPR